MRDVIADTWHRLSVVDRVIVILNLLVGAWNLAMTSYAIGTMSLCIALLYAGAMSLLNRSKEQAELIEALIRIAEIRGGAS